jgi:hypothetical protein
MLPVENLPSYRRLLDADGLRDAADISIIDDERLSGLASVVWPAFASPTSWPCKSASTRTPEATGRTRQLLTEFRSRTREPKLPR